MSKKHYVETAKILRYMSDKIHPAVFSKTVVDFAVMYAQDNPRFDPNKFYEASNYHVPKLATN